MIDKLPRKLLDCEEFHEIQWPEAFEEVGQAIRIDYSTDIHDGKIVPYAHEFDTGARVYAPASSRQCREGGGVWLDEAIAPIVMGVADRFCFDAKKDGKRSRVIFHRKGVGVNKREAAEAAGVARMHRPLMAWDLEGQQLLVLEDDGSVRFVIHGGLLDLNEDAKIVG